VRILSIIFSVRLHMTTLHKVLEASHESLTHPKVLEIICLTSSILSARYGNSAVQQCCFLLCKTMGSRDSTVDQMSLYPWMLHFLCTWTITSVLWAFCGAFILIGAPTTHRNNSSFTNPVCHIQTSDYVPSIPSNSKYLFPKHPELTSPYSSYLI
jgi:hypothetical protein